MNECCSRQMKLHVWRMCDRSKCVQSARIIFLMCVEEFPPIWNRSGKQFQIAPFSFWVALRAIRNRNSILTPPPPANTAKEKYQNTNFKNYHNSIVAVICSFRVVPYVFLTVFYLFEIDSCNELSSSFNPIWMDAHGQSSRYSRKANISQ